MHDPSRSPGLRDADADHLYIPAMAECDDRASDAGRRQSLVGDDLKFNHDPKGIAAQLGSIEQLHAGDGLSAA